MIWFDYIIRVDNNKYNQFPQLYTFENHVSIEKINKRLSELYTVENLVSIKNIYRRLAQFVTGPYSMDTDSDSIDTDSIEDIFRDYQWLRKKNFIMFLSQSGYLGSLALLVPKEEYEEAINKYAYAEVLFKEDLTRVISSFL